MNAKQASNKHKPPISFYNLYGDQAAPRPDDKWRYKFLVLDPQPGASGSSNRVFPYPHYPPLPSTTIGSSILHGQPQQGPITHSITITNQNEHGRTSRRQARVWDPIEVAEAFQTFGKGNYSINSTHGTHHPSISVASGRSSLTTSSSGASHVRIRGISFIQPGEFGENSLPSTPQSRRTTLVSLSPEPISRDISPICSICFDNSNDFPRCGPTLRCTHSPTICIPCMEGHISHSVLTDGLTSISCPIPGCRQILEYEDVLRGAKGDQRCLNRYEALLLRRLLGNDLNFVWCKNPACSWGQIHEGGAEYPLVVCDECNSQSCFTHDIPWHTGFTCREYEARMKDKDRQLLTKNKKKQQQRQEEYETEEFIRKNTKRCPNQLCGRQIQKNGGCNHMTCRPPAGCGHEFCWLCLADYRLILDEGPHRHEVTCEEYDTPYPSIIRIID